ncbi:hypothetical protein RvY_18954 [Ramazzottius varieornatus]|uniref:Uncharacterized protein n=1 Tax=Ramazzottius varieornatus TaxID=947166 RepID=A0A1D1W7P2_RAMVA|nr:hypothetical protein RvY_18954 [Ramazzottius varieornatus]
MTRRLCLSPPLFGQTVLAERGESLLGSEPDYKLHYRIDDFPSEADRQFKDIVKEDLQYDLLIRVESFEDYEASVVQCNLLSGRSEADFDVTEPENRLLEPVFSGTEPSSHELYIPRLPNPKLPVDQLVNLEYKKRAVTYWRNAVKKKRPTLATVQRSFGKLTSIRQLYDWEKQVVEGGSRLEKLKALRLDVGKQFFLAQRKKQVVKDLDLRRWALTANETVNLAGFTASLDWIGRLKRTMFKADNLYVTASTSGKMTKKLYLEWSEKVLFPHMEEQCIFLADSWKTFTDQDSVIELKPEELEYEMLTIPPKVTGQIQPRDVLCFRMYKGCFKKISDFVFLHDLPDQVHHRDVISRLHSLLYQQFQPPRFENLIAEAWHKSGYTDERFMYFNPAKFMSDKLKGSCLHENCRDIFLLVCGWCKARLCFHHSYDAHHFCTIYLP